MKTTVSLRIRYCISLEAEQKRSAFFTEHMRFISKTKKGITKIAYKKCTVNTQCNTGNRPCNASVNDSIPKVITGISNYFSLDGLPVANFSIIEYSPVCFGSGMS